MAAVYDPLTSFSQMTGDNNEKTTLKDCGKDAFGAPTTHSKKLFVAVLGPLRNHMARKSGKEPKKGGTSLYKAGIILRIKRA